MKNILKKQAQRRTDDEWKQLTWYLFSSVEGEPRYLSENAEADGQRAEKQKGVIWSRIRNK